MLIRLVGIDRFACLVVVHTPKGMKWFSRASSVPARWFPRKDLDARSSAFGIQYGGRPDDPAPRKIAADAWFDRYDASRLIVQEQTARVSRDETLSLIAIQDKAMLRQD